MADVDGSWSVWTSWTECSRLCGGGTRSRHRVCDSPAASGTGRECDGHSHQLSDCNTHSCQVLVSTCLSLSLPLSLSLCVYLCVYLSPLLFEVLTMLLNEILNSIGIQQVLSCRSDMVLSIEAKNQLSHAAKFWTYWRDDESLARTELR